MQDAGGQEATDRVAVVLRALWWLPVLRGVLLLVLGLLMLVEPLATLVALVWVFGVFAVVDGLLVLVQALGVRGRPGFGWWLAEAAVGIGFGALIMLWPGATALVLYYLLALWVLVLGVTAVVVAVVQYRARDLAWAGTLVFGLIGFLFGLLLAIRPEGTVDVIVTVFGLFAFVAGVVMVVAGFVTRSFARQLEAARAGVPGGQSPAGAGAAGAGASGAGAAGPGVPGTPPVG